MDKSPDAFRTISEVAEHLETPAHVLRFWESRFPQIRPVKRAGGRRYYRPADVALLAGIRKLLHDEGLTIRGVQKILREQGVRHVSDLPEADGADKTISGADDDQAPFVAITDAELVEQDNIIELSSPVCLADKLRDDAPQEQKIEGLTPALPVTGPSDAIPQEDAAQAADATPATDATPSAPGPDLFATLTQPGPASTAPQTPPAEPTPAPAGISAPPHQKQAPERAKAAESFDMPIANTNTKTAPLWLPTLLRNLAPGALDDRQDDLRPLHARLMALRNRMAEDARADRH